MTPVTSGRDLDHKTGLRKGFVISGVWAGDSSRCADEVFDLPGQFFHFLGFLNKRKRQHIGLLGLVRFVL